MIAKEERGNEDAMFYHFFVVNVFILLRIKLCHGLVRVRMVYDV